MLTLVFLLQIAYWLHIFPELYFQKVKKEDMPARIQYTCLYLFFIGAAYLVSTFNCNKMSANTRRERAHIFQARAGEKY